MMSQEKENPLGEILHNLDWVSDWDKNNRPTRSEVVREDLIEEARKEQVEGQGRVRCLNPDTAHYVCDMVSYIDLADWKRRIDLCDHSKVAKALGPVVEIIEKLRNAKTASEYKVLVTKLSFRREHLQNLEIVYAKTGILAMENSIKMEDLKKETKNLKAEMEAMSAREKNRITTRVATKVSGMATTLVAWVKNLCGKMRRFWKWTTSSRRKKAGFASVVVVLASVAQLSGKNIFDLWAFVVQFLK